jgi:type II secretory pathway pseudopilin PulG
VDLAEVLASWAAVVVAIIVAVRAYISERRAKQSAEDAEVLRQRTAAASERSASAIEQVAEALWEANGTSGASESVPLYRGPTWSLDYVTGSKYALANNTPYAQTDVTITGEPIRGGSERPGDIAAFGEYQFLGISAFGMDDKITVTWTDDVGDEQTWSKALPPKR